MFHRGRMFVVFMFSYIAFVCQADPITGSGTTNYIPKFSSSNTVGDSVIYQTTDGRIGIGTAALTSGQKLHVKDGDIMVQGTDYPTLNWKKTGSTGWQILGQGNDFWFRHGWNSSGTYVADIVPLVITEAGNIGIGTTVTSSGQKLHVKDGDIMVQKSDTPTMNWKKTNSTGWQITLQGDDFWFRRGWDSSGAWVYNPTPLVLTATGKVGIGTTTPSEKLSVQGGNVLVQGGDLTVKDGNIRVLRADDSICAELGDGLDYAEGFNVRQTDGEVQPGTVLVLDSENAGKLTVSSQAYDSKVAGIVAGANNLKSGVRLGVGRFDCDVALAGRVYCNVDATDSAIEVGDLLTTSNVAGYAMKSSDRLLGQGAILGKAMESLEQGKKGQILVLVTLQ